MRLAINKEGFDLQLFDMNAFGENEEEDLRGYDGEYYQEDSAMVNPPETIGIMQTAYASEGSQE